MKSLKKFNIILLLSLLLFSNILIARETNKQELLRLSKKFEEEFKREKAEAIRVAKEKGWVIRREFPDGRIIEIQRLAPNGMPIYYTTTNLNAAKTVGTDELWPGGSTGLNLTGDGFLLGEWDGGGVRTTHRELTGRVTQQDIPAGLSSHSTHVAGTLIASGVDINAKGMAYQADLDAYDWNNDEAEMADAADSLLLSNHSYVQVCGWHWDPDSHDPWGNPGAWFWYGDSTISTIEDYKFGFYGNSAQDWDEIAYNAPDYLIVKAAGNDRNDNHVGWHWVYNPDLFLWFWSDDARDPDGNYDCIPPRGTAKNVLTVGAVDDIPGGYTEVADVVMSVFSSWGPCDDGRIKPDIVANGVNLWSCDDDHNSDYTTKSGTSMATPNVCGTLGLLQGYYHQLNDEYMTAAMLKGLAINTANEAGPNDGPDYMFGWGLFNAEGTVNLITADHNNGDLICEYELENGETDEYEYYSNGTDTIKVTICWTDIPGTPPDDALDPADKMLVNDLDLRLLKDAVTHSPWKLNKNSPANAATTGDNNVDNVEFVYIDDPEPGAYTIRITHKGNIGAGQDYSLIVSGLSKTMHTNTWTGAFNSYWHNDNNWTLGHIPIDDENVVITSDGYHPVKISSYDEECNNLTIESGATLWFHGDHNLTVNDDMTIHGEVKMTDNDAELKVYGDIVWESGSTANITENTLIRIYGNWDFKNGANVHLDNVSVLFIGDEIRYIRSYDADCYFNMIGIYKTDGAYVSISSFSTDTLNINSTLYINTNSEFNIYSEHPVVLKGVFSNNGHFNFDNGTFIFDGTTHSINSNAGDHFKNLTISSSGNTSLDNDLVVNGNLRIESGALVTNNNDIEVGGSWTNIIGDPGFTEGTGTVVFNGSSNQYCYGETFNILELDKPSGDFRIPAGSVTVCISYDWTNGTLNVDGGTFTANDLTDNSICGTIAVTGGELNLHQDAIHYIDLNADLTITDGTMNVFGGSDDSYWSYANDASITMSGGMLDFKDRGIVVSSFGGHTLTESITGGIIRTVGGFTCNRSDFNPTGGTIELYGETDADFSIVSGSNFYNVTINKSALLEKVALTGLTKAKSGSSKTKAKEYVIIENRDGTKVRYAKSKTITATSELDINGDFVIDAGVFDPADSTMYVAGNWANNVGDAGFVEGTGLVVFDGANGADILTDEIFYNLNLDKTYANYYGLEFGVDVTILNDLHIIDGTMELNNPTNLTIGNDLSIEVDAGLNANDAGTINIYVGDDWTDLNDTSSSTAGFDDGSASIVTFNGTSGYQNIQERCHFNNIVINNTGSGIRPWYGNIYCKNLDVSNGKLRHNNHAVIVDEDMTISGILDMSFPEDSLLVDNITWESGSSDIVTGGKIFVSGDWNFNDGTSAQLGTSNTVYFDGSNTSLIYSMDADAEFGNLVIDKTALTTWIHTTSTDTMRVAGNMTVNAGNHFKVQNGNLLVEGTLDIENTGEMDLSSGGTLTNNSNFTLNGLLDVNTGDALIHGTFELAATGTLTIDGGSFISDAAFTKDRAWQNLRGEFNLSDGLFEITNNSLQFVSGIHTITGGIIRVGGTFYAMNAGMFQPSNGEVEMTDGYSGGSIVCSNANGNYFYNLIINDDTSLSTDLTIDNDLEINSGTLSANSYDIEIGGNWTNNVGDAGFNEGVQAVTFNGNSDADITTNETFYNLTVDKTASGWKDLEIMDSVTVNITNDLTIIDGTLEMNNNSTLNIVNDLDIALDAGLNAYSDTGLNITIGGNWTNNNTTYDSWVGFYPGTSTTTFNGSADQEVNTDCVTEDFYNLVIDKSGGDFKPYDNVQVLGDVTISNGRWYRMISGLLHYFYGDFSITGDGIWYDRSSTLTFKGTGDQTINAPTVGNALFYNDVVIDKSAKSINKPTPTGEELLFSDNDDRSLRNQTVTLLSEFRSMADAFLTVEEGTLDLNSYRFRGTGDVTINNGGKIIVDAGAELTIGGGNDLTVNNGGILEVIGTSGNEATITHTSDYYNFNVESGGTISAEYGIFEYMSANGVQVKDGAIIDATHPFNNCIFRNGIAVGTLLTVNNDQILTIANDNFPTNTWAGTSNVSKTLDQGHLTFTGATGGFAGPNYENDPHDRIDWTGFAPDLTITNAVWSDMSPYICDTIDVEVTVKNIGTVDVTDWFYVDLYYNLPSPPIPNQVGNQHVSIPGLPAGDSVIVNFYTIWDSVPGIWSSYVQVDTEQEITELDEGNNVWGPDAITWNALPAITDLVIQYNTGTGEVELSWSYPVVVDSFYIYRDTDPYFTPVFGAHYTSIDTANTFWSEPATGTKHFYIVTAVKNAKLPLVKTSGNTGRISKR